MTMCSCRTFVGPFLSLIFLMPFTLFSFLAKDGVKSKGICCLAFAASTSVPSMMPSVSSNQRGRTRRWHLLPQFFRSCFSKEGGGLFAGVEPNEPIPFSSRQMAAVRALEAERPDRLFDDNLSRHFAGSEAMGQARERADASRASQGIGRKIAVRTRFFDDFLLDCCGHQAASPASSSTSWFSWLIDGGGSRRGMSTPPLQQVLILGSGMDARAWRLPLNDTVLIEVDVDPVLRAKEAVLKQVFAEQAEKGKELGGDEVRLTVKRRTAVAADVSQSRWIQEVKSVLNSTQGLAVVMEGLLMYLKEDDVLSVLKQVGELACVPGSRVGISLVDTRSVQDAQQSSSPLRQSWLWGCDEEKAVTLFEQALTGAGRGRWQVTHVIKVGDAGGFPTGANYGCWNNVGKWKRQGKTLYVLATRFE